MEILTFTVFVLVVSIVSIPVSVIIILLADKRSIKQEYIPFLKLVLYQIFNKINIKKEK